MNALRKAFPGQNSNEPVFIFLRKHWLSYLPMTVGIVVMLAISILIMLFALTRVRDNPQFSIDFYNWLIALDGIVGLFSVVFATVTWFDFYFDIYIVTDSRVIDVAQNRLFNREISELSLEDIEDVSVLFSGVFSTVFNYGDVAIQTAGTRNNFLFESVSNPRIVASIIVDLAEQAKSGIKEENRFPHSEYVGMINNQIMKNRADLVACGALRPDEKMAEHE